MDEDRRSDIANDATCDGARNWDGDQNLARKSAVESSGTAESSASRFLAVASCVHLSADVPVGAVPDLKNGVGDGSGTRAGREGAKAFPPSGDGDHLRSSGHGSAATRCRCRSGKHVDDRLSVCLICAPGMNASRDA